MKVELSGKGKNFVHFKLCGYIFDAVDNKVQTKSTEYIMKLKKGSVKKICSFICHHLSDLKW